ncbi:MAG: WecB/TagA/CpsF family glycosyltransferase [Spongiibacteraceae bacterium]
MDYQQVFSRDVFCILGLPFDAVSLAEAAERITASIQRKEKLFLSTPNLNWLRTAHENAEFRASVLLSDLSIADGMPVVLLARLLSIPVTQRVAGSDLIDVLSQTSRMNIFFFGGDNNNAEVAVERVNAAALPMRAVGGINPGYGSIDEMSEQRLLDAINDSAPDFVIVSLGAVRGQAWIVRNRHRLNATVISHLGAVVNFFAGTVQRAPRVLQRMSLEWVWRIYQEPQLASRYFKDAVFLANYLLLKAIPYKFLQLNASRTATGELTMSRTATSTRIVLSGSFGAANIEKTRAIFVDAMHARSPIVIDMQCCEYFDAMFLGALLLLKKCRMETGLSLSIVGSNRKVRRLLYYFNAKYLLDADDSHPQ